MVELYEAAQCDGEMWTYLQGPPGIGKTTSLYWLYKQLKHHNISVLTVNLCKRDMVIIESSISGPSSVVVFVDLLSPLVISQDGLTDLMGSLYKVVVAQLSFCLFTILVPHVKTQSTKTEFVHLLDFNCVVDGVSLVHCGNSDTLL